MRLQGHLDCAEPGVVAGWVVDLDAPDRRIGLHFHVGAETLGHGEAGLFRADLLAAGMGDGHCFFVFDPPRTLTADELAALTIRLDDYPFIFFAASRHLVARALPRPEGAGRWRCVLHIGTEKTGTTSVQGFLALNREALAERGYFVPVSLAAGGDPAVLNSDLIATYARADNAPVEFGRRGSDPSGFRALLAARLAAELAAAPAGCHTMILSGEHCHSLLQAGFEVEGVRQLLAPFCADIRVLVYLRPQHEMALSAYGMMLRNGQADVVALPRFDGAERPRAMGFGYFDHAALLARWAAEFGREALVPRLFAREALARGDIIDDVLVVLGIEGGGFVRPARLNSNLAAPALRFLAGLNRALAGRSAAESARVRNWVLLRLAPGSGILPGRDEVAAFMAQFAAGNEVVRAAWFAERTALFEVDLAHYPMVADAADAGETFEVLVAMMLL